MEKCCSKNIFYYYVCLDCLKFQSHWTYFCNIVHWETFSSSSSTLSHLMKFWNQNFWWHWTFDCWCLQNFCASWKFRWRRHRQMDWSFTVEFSDMISLPLNSLLDRSCMFTTLGLVPEFYGWALSCQLTTTIGTTSPFCRSTHLKWFFGSTIPRRRICCQAAFILTPV